MNMSMSNPVLELARGETLDEPKQAVSDMPSSAFAALSRSEIDQALETLVAMNAPDAAEALIKRATEGGASVTFPLAQAARLADQGKDDAALSLIRAWPLTEDARPPEHLKKVLALYRFGDGDGGRALLDRAAEKFPKTPHVIWTKAQRAHQDGDIDVAVEFYERAKKLNPAFGDEADLIVTAIRDERAKSMGLDLSLPRDVISPVVLLSILRGGYEKAERDALLSDLNRDDRLLELGTGAGIVAMSVARAFPDMPIMTVEANPGLVPIIRENFSRNGCTAELVEGVAGLKDGQATLNLSKRFPSSSTRQLDQKGTVEITVPSVDVNRLIAEFGPSVMTIDVEGTEVDILPSLNLAGVRRLVVEFHPQLCEAVEISNAVGSLLSQGYILDIGPADRNVFGFNRVDNIKHSRETDQQT